MRKRSAIPEHEGDLAVGQKPFEGDRQFVAALHRGLEILRCFKPGDEGLSNLELCQRSGLGPSTVSRLTYTLSHLGYLRYDQRTGRYSLGVAVLGLGYACLAGLRIRDTAQPLMQEMAERVGGGVLVALSARDNLRMTYIACARSSEGVMSLQLDVGSRLSMARSAAGRAYLAAIPAPERERLIAELEARADPEIWPATLTGIRDSLKQVEERGFCMSLGNWRAQVNTAGVPLRAPEDGALYALTCGGAAYNLPRLKLEREVGPMLLELAARISRQ